jgi:hypothetical protein
MCQETRNYISTNLQTQNDGRSPETKNPRNQTNMEKYKQTGLHNKKRRKQTANYTLNKK